MMPKNILFVKEMVIIIIFIYSKPFLGMDVTKLF